MNVYGYWQGPKPAWIQLCIESLHKNTPGIQMLDPVTWWGEHFKGSDRLRAHLEIQPPNIISDYIRAYMLFHHGGVWVDADCICFKDLAEVGKLAWEPNDFVAYTVKKKSEVCSALIASRPGTDTARHYLSIMDQKLMATNRPKRLGRIALGPMVLRRAMNLSGRKVHLIPQNLVHPHCHWHETAKRKLWRQTMDDMVPIADDAWCYMLTNRALGCWRNMGKKELMNLHNVVGVAFRRALA